MRVLVIYVLALTALCTANNRKGPGAEEVIREMQELIRRLKPSCMDRCLNWMPDVKKAATMEYQERQRKQVIPPNETPEDEATRRRNENIEVSHQRIAEMKSVIANDCGIKEIAMTSHLNSCDAFLRLESKILFLEDMNRTSKTVCLVVCDFTPASNA